MYNNLKTLRKKAGVTQAQMAHDLGVAVSTIQNWESDRTEMTGYSLLMVADYLNVSPNAIFGRQDVEYVHIKLQSNEEKLLELYAASSAGGQQRILEYSELIAKEYPKSEDVEGTA